MADCERTCEYVAKKEDPSSWHGEESSQWILDRNSPTGLELEVWECPHDALNEKEYCAFHTDPENLPAEIDEGKLLIEAINEASVSEDESVARRKKQFVGATFGPLNIGEAVLDAGDEHPILLTHAKFTAGIFADETVIRHGLRAERTHLKISNDYCDEIGPVSFENARFSGDAYLLFNNAQCSGDGGLSFDHAKFTGGGYLSFRRAQFSDETALSFNNVEFSDKADLSFRRAQFSDEANLWFNDAVFNGDGGLGFDDAEFSGKADLSFNDTQFSDEANLLFRRAQFSDEANLLFRRAQFSGETDLSFNDAQFSGETDLSFNDAQFSGETDLLFRRAQFSDEGDKANVSFDRAKFSSETDLRFDDTKFSGGGLFFRHAKFYNEYDNTNLSFDRADFGGNSGISFYDAVFSGDSSISFRGTELSGEVSSFRHTVFCGEGGRADFRFYDAQFSGDSGLSFDYAQFNDTTDLSFNNVEFSDTTDLSFNDAQFSDTTDLSFNDAQFSDTTDLSFRRAVFCNEGDKANVSFDRTKFSGDGGLSFENARFSGDGDLSFENARFSGEADVEFNHTQFSGETDLSFSDAEFSGDGDLSLSHAQFSGDGCLSFEETKISRVCYLIDSYFEPEREVTFTGAEVEERLTFKQSGDVSSRYVRGQFDFSDATFHDELRFLSSRQSITYQKDDSGEQTKFDLVFADAVDFNGTSFRHPPDFSTTRFPADTDFTGASFQNTDFQNADVTGTVETSTASFDAADLSNVNFSGANLTGASFERALLSRAELLGANLTRTKLYGAVLGDARINRKTKFWLRSDALAHVSENSSYPIRALQTIKRKLRKYSHRGQTEPYCVYDPRYRGTDGEPELEKAIETYGMLETLASQNSLPRLASECFLGRKDVRFKQYWRDHNWLMIIRSAVPTVVARYGESPTRVLGSGGLTILVMGFAYFVFDLIKNTETGEPATLFESLYFSALTFTTLGYGDFKPVTGAGQVLAVVETSIGVILLAILVFVFGRRATR